MQKRLNWHELTSDGPSAAYAAACIVDQTLYVHGGVAANRSTVPLSSFYKYSIEHSQWHEITKPGSPALSQHCCISDNGTTILFIGGWNGKTRCADVFAFDCKEEEWVDVVTSGFPSGAGLSSHTATKLQNGDILVIGREGSLRTQRRSGNAFILSGSVQKRAFTYKECPMTVASRSGHTTTCIRNSLLVIGGRDDKLTELHKAHAAGAEEQNTSLSDSIKSISDSLDSMSKLPGGRKGHSATLIGNIVMVFGGETFDGRSKVPVADVYAIDTSNHYTWKYLGKTNIARAGHSVVVTKDNVYLHGGIGERNQITNSTYKLVIGS